jgi:hypothetical protein
MSCCSSTVNEPTIVRRFTGCGVQDINPNTFKSWYSFHTNSRTGVPTQFDGQLVELRFVRKGKEAVVVAYAPFSRGVDGTVSFYWDDELFKLPAGFYTADVYVDGEYCVSLPFRQRRCELAVVACKSETVVCDDTKDCEEVKNLPLDVEEVGITVQCSTIIEDEDCGNN